MTDPLERNKTNATASTTRCSTKTARQKRWANSLTTPHSRTRALGLAFVVLTVVAASCTGSDDAATTTAAPVTATSAAPAATTSTVPPPSTSTTTVAPTTTTTTTTTTLPPVALPAFADDSEPLPVDGGVLIGTFDNGITYFIRENTAPGLSAELRLAVKAGSVQEDPGQRGAAHYLEHMMFNGTEKFPANELVKVLSRFGAEFGPDVSAYTGYQETVYKLSLSTEDRAILESGFDVLFEWATAVALDPEEVDLERGVLLEEWRLRDQGFWGRYRRGVIDTLLADTAFEDREPLADPDQLDTTTPEGLRAFFDTWYRPDTMAVVAVGDFAAADIEQMIVERFAGIPAADDPVPVPDPTTDVASETAYFVIADPEFSEAWSELNYPVPAGSDPDTIGVLRSAFATDLAWNMLATRLSEDTLRGTTPFFNSGRAANDLVRAHSTPGLLAWADPDKLGVTTEALLLEIKRARTFGFSEEEFDRAVEELRTFVQLDFDEQGTTQDREYAGRYVESFFGGGPIPSARDRFDLDSRLLDEMTADQVWQTFSATIDSTEPFVIIVAPENAADVIPDEDDLAAIVEAAAAAPVAPWNDPAVEVESLMLQPDRAGVSRRATFSDTGIPELELANGARVVMITTEIRDDVVVMRAQSPGGWSLVPEPDVVEAQFASTITTTSGVAQIDQVSLDRALADQFVFVVPFIGEVTEGLFGEATTDDLETMFQLINLYMSQPRFEQSAADRVISEELAFAVNAHRSPDLAVQLAIADARYSGDDRFAPVPSVEDLETFDLARAETIYQERFLNAGDFVFVFSGDFLIDDLEDLARRYIGTLPGDSATDGFTDTRPDPPTGVLERLVEAGTGELGGITLVFANEIPLDPEIRVDVALLDLILQQRLTDRIREELSASYSPFSVATLVEEPVDSVEFTIRISADPADLDSIAAAALSEIADLRDAGPTEDELFIAQQLLSRDWGFISNEGLADAVLFYAQHPDEVLSEIITRVDRAAAARISDIRAVAQLVLPEDRYIDVRLVPIDFDQ